MERAAWIARWLDRLERIDGLSGGCTGGRNPLLDMLDDAGTRRMMSLEEEYQPFVTI